MPEETEETNTKPPKIGGGPLGFGDPEDKKLRKTERDIILPKLIREEARKKCPETVKVFLDCSKSEGLMAPFRCQKENSANNECIAAWAKNPAFVKEVTDKYLERRSHFRRTGEPVEKYERIKRSSSIC